MSEVYICTVILTLTFLCELNAVYHSFFEATLKKPSFPFRITMRNIMSLELTGEWNLIVKSKHHSCWASSKPHWIHYAQLTAFQNLDKLSYSWPADGRMTARESPCNGLNQAYLCTVMSNTSTVNTIHFICTGGKEVDKKILFKWTGLHFKRTIHAWDKCFSKSFCGLYTILKNSTIL